ncbi:MAG: hypothetical protein PUH36_06335 [Subdoligranulum sp.]|nr:hypothetical protein [Subdoligranulum sp.]
MFAVELFAFWGKKPIRAHKKPKKHRVRPASTAGKPAKTGRHCSDTARKPKKNSKKLPGTGKARGEGRWGGNVLTQHRRAGVF